MRRHADIRWRSLVFTSLAVLAIGVLVQQLTGMRDHQDVSIESAGERLDQKTLDARKADNVVDRQVEQHFKRAVMMLHARQFEYAIPALQKTIELAPRMPEAYVNMGYALLGLKNYEAASQYFVTAIDLRPAQANAYWGLAVSLEHQDDYDAAIGAMRTYIHLSDPADPFLKKASAAIWEWNEARKKSRLKDE